MALKSMMRAILIGSFLFGSTTPALANPAARQGMKKAARMVPKPAPRPIQRPPMAVQKYKAPNTALAKVEKWPANDGFKGAPKDDMTKVGDQMSRYGSRNGTYLAPAGTPFEQRALPYKSGLSVPEDYVVKKPFPVKSGPAAPAFGFSGGGTQYKAKDNVQSLIDSGHLEAKK